MYTSTRNEVSSPKQQQQHLQASSSSQQPIPTASSSVRSRSPVAPASNQRVKIQAQPKLPHQQQQQQSPQQQQKPRLQPSPYGGGEVRTRSMISSSSIGSGNPAPWKKALNEAVNMTEQLPLPSGAVAAHPVADPRLPETRPLNRAQEWLQSTDAYSHGEVDFTNSAAGGAASAAAAARNTAAFQSSVQETGEAGECHNTDELDEKLARFYEEISLTSTAQYRQPPQHQHLPPQQPPQHQNQSQLSSGGHQSALPSSFDGAGDRSARTYGSGVSGGGSTIESMSDQLSDLSLGLTEEAKKELDKVELVFPDNVHK